MTNGGAGQSETTGITQEPFPINIIRLTEAHTAYFAELARIFQQEFHSGNTAISTHQHLQQLLSDQNLIVMVAIQSNKVIGGLTAYVLHSYHATNPTVYIYDLAVMADWQRRGVGKRLVSFLVQFSKEKGYKEIFVQAEANDADAVAFYRNTPISGEADATQFYYTLTEE